MVVGLHGREQTPDYLIDHLISPLQSTRSMTWILPAAPAKSWYPDRADEESERNRLAIQLAINRMKQIERELRHIPSDRLVWLGFSQGACVACEHVARAGRAFGGLAALTGGLVGSDPAGFRVEPLPGPMPALFTAGDGDPWITPARVRRTADEFAGAGASVTVRITPDDQQHRIRADEIRAVAALLDGV